MNLYNFLISSMIIILLPGTGVIYTLSNELSFGKRAAFFAATSCTLGIIPHLTISIAFTSFIHQMGTRLFPYIKFFGGIYLLYLGIDILRSNASLSFHNEEYKRTPRHLIQQGVLINLLNPKLTLFFFAFLPQYASHSKEHYLSFSWFYGLLFMFLTWIVFIGYGFLAGCIQKKLISKPYVISILSKVFGAIFFAFSFQMIFSALHEIF